MVGRERKGGGWDGKPTLDINAGCGLLWHTLH